MNRDICKSKRRLNNKFWETKDSNLTMFMNSDKMMQWWIHPKLKMPGGDNSKDQSKQYRNKTMIKMVVEY